MYAKTINPLCAGNKVFVKYHANGRVFNPNLSLAFTLACFTNSTYKLGISIDMIVEIQVTKLLT